MTLNLFSIVTLFSIFLTIVLVIFFLFTKNGHGNENKILAFLLVLFSLQIVYSFFVSIVNYQFFVEWHMPLYLLRQTSFLIGPAIYFYVNAFIKRKVLVLFKMGYHFLPFVGMVVFLLIFYRYNKHFTIWESNFDFYNTILILSHNLLYFLLCILAMKKLKISFRDLHKDIKYITSSSWLRIIILGFVFIWVINLNSVAIVYSINNYEWCAYTESTKALTFFLFICTIMFAILFKPDIYYFIEKYKNNKLSELNKNEYLQRLSAYMEKEKAYLNPEISLEMVANAISINPRILSQIINETFGKNFKGYVLEYRLKESMQLLTDSKYSEHTILEILYKVGFNAKSSFNNQFKLYTSLTPNEYRAKFLN